MSRCIGFVSAATNCHLTQRVLLSDEASVLKIVTFLYPDEQSAGRHAESRRSTTPRTCFFG